MKILVLGATGMLGNAMLSVLSEAAELDVYGSIRAPDSKRWFSQAFAGRLISGVEVTNDDSLTAALEKVKPDVLINCIGLIKQIASAEDPVEAITINALLPHRLNKLCHVHQSRLIHFSTDCVFRGDTGGYTESSVPDATDLYGKSKFLGEVVEDALTLRTSIIGHELATAHSLVAWFLAQQQHCKGYRQAIFSGLPTTELARIVRDYVIPNPDLTGLYHVAVEAISKFDLLRLIADVYKKKIDIIPDDMLVIDRSLNADRFAEATGYRAPSWPDMIEAMRVHYKY